MPKANKTIDKYLLELKGVYPYFDKDFQIIMKAVDLAKIAHKWQYRKLSGNLYIFHPLRVAIMIAKKTDNLTLILAAILHDTVEDAPGRVSMKDIYNEFDEEVWYLVDSVTDNILFFHKDPDVKFKDKTDKLLTWAIEDARCAVLKLVDREHNNKTLKWLKTDKQIRKSFETQALYAPLRKILRLDEDDFVLKDTCKLFSLYMKEHEIKDVAHMKSHMYKLTFHDIDSENFELFYYASDSIVWEITDKKMFEELTKHESFDDNIEIISLKQDSSDNFGCLFKYKKWQVFDEKFKVSISSFIK